MSDRPVLQRLQHRIRLADHKPALEKVQRRLFLRQSLSLGALTLLSGCNLSEDNDATDRLLSSMSRWNDKVQAALFNPNKLAPVYPDSAITQPFPFNAYYEEAEAPVVDGDAYKLELGGKIAEKQSWTLAQLRALPQTSQVTRHICVEGWSAIGKWGGVPFRTFLERVGADLTARYVGFQCADKYHSSIDMATALHPQTILATKYAKQAITDPFGFPLRLRTATKLGFKNPKWITAMEVTNTYPGGYWEDRGFNWFAGL